MICAGFQLLVGLPFLFNYPVNYIIGAFNLGRVFLYKWTVNFRYLPTSLVSDLGGSGLFLPPGSDP